MSSDQAPSEAVHHSAVYAIHGTFAHGMAGDGFAGLLLLHARTDGATAALRLNSCVIAGRAAPGRLDEALEDVRMTPAGAVSFRLTPKHSSPWVFTAFVSERTISGSHRLDRGPGKPPLTGWFTGERMEDPPAP